MICLNQATFIFMIIFVIIITLLILIAVRSYYPPQKIYETSNLSQNNLNPNSKQNYPEIKNTNYLQENNLDKNRQIMVSEIGQDLINEERKLNLYNQRNVINDIERTFPFNQNDVIRQYDYSRAYDPLEQPARRLARNEIYPFYLKRIIDLPTRGYPDNFSQIGILVKQCHSKSNDPNKILRLFGRKEFPSSNRYEYYTAINSGMDQIKIPLYNNLKRRTELYDDDIIFIKELRCHYQVKLHKYDAPRYYPDII